MVKQIDRPRPRGIRQGKPHAESIWVGNRVRDTQPKGNMYTPEAHVLLAKDLTHPFQSPPNLQMNFKFASETSVADVNAARMQRMKKAQRLAELAEKAESLDQQIWDRMSASVRVVAGKARFSLLTVLMFVLRWPDWQLTSLYTRGF